jgi:hypothetical protein
MEEKMKKHVTVVAAIQVGFALLGLLGALGALLGLSIARSAVGDEEVAGPILGILQVSVPLFLGLTSTLGLVGGIGLFGYKQWARYIVIVLSAMGLIIIPIGTLKGVYFLWVLLQSDTIKVFEKQGTATPTAPTSI